MKSELEKLIEKWEQEKGSYIPNAPIYQCFIDEAKEALKKEKNKWVKIESEKDLPKQRGQEDVWVFDESGIVCTASSVHLNDPEIRRYWMKTVSHYQPIQKPEPPLF